MKSEASGSALRVVQGQLLQAEASFLQQQNLRHKAACSELAFQFSLTQTRLQVRTAELAKVRRPVEASGRVLELRRQAGKLEKEGERLRERAKSLGEGLRLQGDITQAKELQRLYLEKLKELKEHWPGEGAGKLKQTQEELQATSKERDYYRITVLPVLTQTLDLYEQHKANLLSEITALSTPKPGTSRQKTSWSTLKGAVYTPSFLRTRAPALKVKSRHEMPTTQPIVEFNEFADAFPEEDEFLPCE